MNKIRLNHPIITIVIIHTLSIVLRFTSSSSYAINTNNNNNCHLNGDERHSDEDSRRLILHLQQAIIDGRLSQARRLALELLIHFPDCERALARIYNKAIDDEIMYNDNNHDDGGDDNDHDDESIKRYLNLVQQRVTEDDDDDRLEMSSSSSVVGTPLPDDDSRKCWDGFVVGRNSQDDDRSARLMASEAWDRCCSRLPLTGGDMESSRTVNGVGGGGGAMMSSLASSAKSFGGVSWRGTTTNNNNENDRLMCFNSLGTPRCCDFFLDSLSYLRLPALHEISLRIRLPLDNNDNDSDDGNDNDEGNSSVQQQQQQQYAPLEVEQNGFLRPFDVSGMLWPSGYLLALCVAAPVACGIPEIITAAISSSQRGDSTTTTTIGTAPVALELGAGIGVPSIALAKSLSRLKRFNVSGTSPLVIATDNSPHALMLMMANCRSTRVAVAHADYNDDHSIQKLKEKLETYHRNDSTSHGSKDLGFHIILGSSLQWLFDDTENPEAPLWILLDKLLSKDNPQAIVLLAHSKIQPINIPVSDPDRKSAQPLFVRVGRVSGDALRMLTRDGASSDFEISAFRRAPIIDIRNMDIDNEL